MHGFTRTAHGAIALVGDSVLGASLGPPLVERSRFGFTSPTICLPARRKVDPGSFRTELGWDGPGVRCVRRSRTVSTERPPPSGDGKPVDESPAREDERIAIGWDGFSVEVSLVLASLSAMAPFWLFSIVSMAGLTLPWVISVVASPRVGLAGVAFPPKLICLRNQFDGLGLCSSLAGASVAEFEIGGKTALFGGE